jgi:hypothetical protein
VAIQAQGTGGGRNISVSGVMPSAQNRYRPQPLTWSEDETIGLGTS